MGKRILSVVITAVIFSTLTAKAQEQGFSLGARIGSAWNHNVTIQAQDTLYWMIGPSLNLRTSITEHSVSYDFVNKKARISSAFRFERGFDLYVCYEQDVSKKFPLGIYGSAGFKMTMAPIREIEIDLFAELGNNLICTSFVRFGVTLHPQYFFERRVEPLKTKFECGTYKY